MVFLMVSLNHGNGIWIVTSINLMSETLCTFFSIYDCLTWTIKFLSKTFQKQLFLARRLDFFQGFLQFFACVQSQCRKLPLSEWVLAMASTKGSLNQNKHHPFCKKNKKTYLKKKKTLKEKIRRQPSSSIPPYGTRLRVV